MDKKYYTVDETAYKIGVHSKTIRRYIYSGKLAATKVAGQWRVYEDAIENYLNSCNGNCEHNSVSKDDFCVFMDSDYFNSDEKVQICTIVDYYVQTAKEAKPMAAIVMDVVTDSEQEEGKCRFNYVYDHVEKKARFILWGSPTFIEKVVGALKQFE
ncbi:MAG: helix-turn-helix domain-containing protein [Vallitalea sp.]|jgi:excisionase family DNA binding protein|nr:helix-turn-helix domain-containing protein [Vallitalea sp.]